MLIRKKVYHPPSGYVVNVGDTGSYRCFLGGWFWKEFDDGVDFTTA